jgi:predicted phosphodiesterase
LSRHIAPFPQGFLPAKRGLWRGRLVGTSTDSGFVGGRGQGGGPLRPESCAPVLYWTGKQEVTLAWPVAGLSQGWVEYGPTPKMGRKAVAGEDVPDFVGGFTTLATRSNLKALAKPNPDVLKARLKALTPGQCIYYRVDSQQCEGKGPPTTGDVRKFTLPDPAAPETSIAVWNDTHDHHDTLRALHKLTAQEPTGLLVWNGDISNNIEREDQIVPLYLAPAHGLDITPTFPLVFARGNHDVRGQMAFRLGHYTGFRRSYYSFRIGPVAGIVLDTGEDKPDDHPSFRGRVAFEPYLREQAEWLGREIDRPGLADAPYRVVFCHIPLRWKEEVQPDYAHGGFDHVSLRGRALWHNSLVRWKTHMVVSGHTHEWRYIASDKTFPYAQLVGGGPLFQDACLLRLSANAKALKIRVLALTGQMLHQENLAPMGS